jgi:hypothetical protein
LLRFERTLFGSSADDPESDSTTGTPLGDCFGELSTPLLKQQPMLVGLK